MLRLIRNFIGLSVGLLLLGPGAAGAQTLTSSTATTTASSTVAADVSIDMSMLGDLEEVEALDAETVEALEREVDDVIDQVVVTGSRTAKSVKDAPVATDVVDRTEIVESGAENMEELLEAQPGVLLERNGNATGVQIQGFNPSQVLVLVDGERVAGKLRNTTDLGRFNLQDVEQVEIVRGAASSLYGADAMGGVVNIIPRRPKEPLSTMARATIGSFGAFDAIGNIGTRLGRFSTIVSGGYHRADAYSLTDGDATTGDEFAGWDVSANTVYEADEDTRGRLRLRYRTQDLTGVGFVPPRAAIDRNERIETFTISAGPEIDLTGPSKLKVSVVHSRYRQQIISDQRGGTEFDSDEDNRQTSSQVVLQYDRLIAGQHFVSVGVEGLYETQEVEFIGALAQDRRRGSIFLQDEWTILDAEQRLVVIPSARLDSDSQFGTRISPRIAARFDPFEDLTFRASYGWGFRAPSFEELYLQFTNVSAGYRIDGNPGLVPEISQGFNVDAAYQLAKHFDLTAAAFYNDIDSLIETLRFPDPMEAPCARVIVRGFSQFCYDNVSEATTAGASVGANFRSKYVGAFASLDYLHTKGLFADGTERELPFRPNLRATLRVTGTVPEWGSSLVIRSAVEGPAESNVDFDNDGVEDDRETFVNLDARLSQRLFGAVELFAGIENALDAGETNTLPIRPRTFYAGIGGRYEIAEKDTRPTSGPVE